MMMIIIIVSVNEDVGMLAGEHLRWLVLVDFLQ